MGLNLLAQVILEIVLLVDEQVLLLPNDFLLSISNVFAVILSDLVKSHLFILLLFFHKMLFQGRPGHRSSRLHKSLTVHLNLISFVSQLSISRSIIGFLLQLFSNVEWHIALEGLNSISS